jgi:hypothetical protein
MHLKMKTKNQGLRVVAEKMKKKKQRRTIRDISRAGKRISEAIENGPDSHVMMIQATMMNKTI